MEPKSSPTVSSLKKTFRFVSANSPDIVGEMVLMRPSLLSAPRLGDTIRLLGAAGAVKSSTQLWDRLLLPWLLARSKMPLPSVPCNSLSPPDRVAGHV